MAFRGGVLPFLFVTWVGAAVCSWADVPPRTESGTTLVVPDEEKKLGRVYYVRYPAHTAQITFTSDAPIERIVGTSLRVVGYAVLEVKEERPTGKILAGGCRLPVHSLDTGIPLRNEHMLLPNFLDADRYPEITYEFLTSRDLKEKETNDNSRRYTLTLTGRMTIRGVAKELEIPAEIDLMPASDVTRNAGHGDVMALRCRYGIQRSAFGIGTNFVNSELLDELQIDQCLIFTTVPRESHLADSPDPERATQMQRLEVLIRDFGDFEAATKLGKKLLKQYWDDDDGLNDLAWRAATTEGSYVNRFSFVLEAAKRANELSQEKNADFLDTLARVHYEKGSVEKAIEWQRKAVKERESASDAEEIVKTLHRYEKEAGVPTTVVAGIEIKDLPHTPQMLKRYSGTYRVKERNFVVKCRARDDRLVAEPGGHGAIPLLYQGGHEFRLSVQISAKFVFHVENERATALEIHQGRTIMRAERVEDPDR